MAVHLEFVVPGPPISNQQGLPQGKTKLATWRTTVALAAQLGWPGAPALTGPSKAVIINFHPGNKPSLDLDNMSKPILDALQGIAYDNDRQIHQALLTHVRIDALFSVVGVSKVIVNALQAGEQFVYVRIEDPVDPDPLSS